MCTYTKIRANLMCKYTYLRLHSDLSVKYVKFLSSFQASICAQRTALWDELVMSLEDHLGVPYCKIGE